MKKIVLLSLALSLLQISMVFAQRDKGPRSQGLQADDLAAVKTALITQALGLSTEQAEKFWPIYRKYDQQIKTLKREQVASLHGLSSEEIEQWNDDQVKNALNLLRQNKVKEHELIGQMEGELKGVITDKQILQLHLSEERFRRRLINRMKSRRNGPRN